MNEDFTAVESIKKSLKDILIEMGSHLLTDDFITVWVGMDYTKVRYYRIRDSEKSYMRINENFLAITSNNRTSFLELNQESLIWLLMMYEWRRYNGQ